MTQIGKPEQIDRLIAGCSSLNLVGRVELLRAVRAGIINLVEPRRDFVVPLKVLTKALRPQIVVIGDDDYASTGPTAWPATRRLVRWATGALVHASGATAESYRLAIEGALSTRKFLLIETDSAHAAEWAAVLAERHIPTLTLMPRDGVHPVLPKREAVN